jgi:hypothetical protein
MICYYKFKTLEGLKMIFNFQTTKLVILSKWRLIRICFCLEEKQNQKKKKQLQKKQNNYKRQK